MGHFSRDCNDFARTNGLAWQPISLQKSTSISENPTGQGNGAGVIGIACPVSSSPPSLHQSPLLFPKKTPSPPRSNRLWRTMSLIHNVLFRQATTSSMVEKGGFLPPSSRLRLVLLAAMRITWSPRSCLLQRVRLDQSGTTLFSFFRTEVLWFALLSLGFME